MLSRRPSEFPPLDKRNGRQLSFVDFEEVNRRVVAMLAHIKDDRRAWLQRKVLLAIRTQSQNRPEAVTSEMIDKAIADNTYNY